MIAASPLAKGVAALAAVALHGAVVASLFSGEDAQIEGGTPGVEASLGDSFADMSTGVMTAQTPEEVIEKAPAKAEASQIPPDQAVEAPRMPEVSRAVPVITRADQPEASSVAPVRADDVVVAARASDERAQVVAARPSQRVAPSPDTAVETAREPSLAVSRSLRPKTRSAAFEAAHKAVPRGTAAPEPKAAPAKTAGTVQPKGNAKQSAKTGDATGRKTAPSAGSTGASKKAALGNAAASNYPGLVLKRISKVPRPRVGSRGTAVVAFRISSNGGLAAVSLARSSGSPKLDQAALTVIRQAAPFPPPPPGARRSFSINVQGR